MKHSIFGWLSLIIVVTGVISTGCSNHQATPKLAEVPDEYQIGVSDVIEVRVWMEDGLSRVVVVRPDGMISLPLINDVKAEGLTPMELRDVLTEEFGRYVSTPEVSVIVDEVRSYMVSVLGEVREPGRYPLDGRSTVLDMIAQAGGFTEFASRSRITLIRNDGINTSRETLSFAGMVRRDAQSNVLLKSGDVIVVH
jgi:polysaccharide biosynthesis/export protein